MTSRHDDSDALRADPEVLRQAFAALDEALLIYDAAGALVFENTAGRRLLDAASELARAATTHHDVGTPAVDEAGAPDPGVTLELSLTRLAREASAKEARFERNVTYGGRHLLVRASPLAQRRALLFVRDVTDEREREVRRLQSEKLASIGMMAAGVAHEINNPASFVLANIDSLAGVLRLIDDKLAAAPEVARRLGLRDLLFEATSVLQESKEGMARIHRIVRDLHSFSRVDDDATALCDVNASIESALTMLRNELKYRATVERHLEALRPVRASSARLGQVFLNLVINAAHAMLDGNPTRNRLWVRTRDEDSDVVIEIEDNGPGIAPEVMPRIFDSFFTTKGRGLGTGLGLPISRDIVTSMGGEISAESAPGRGALFRVRLPAVHGDALDAAPSHRGKPVVAGRRLRVLAIDDEALLLKAYRRMLIDHHDVEVRVGAREALRLLETDVAFDIVLCDLQMPDMSGAELYATVRERWPALAERFIFITGGAFSPDARKFLDEAQPPACIHKPFHVNELLDLMERRSTATPAPTVIDQRLDGGATR